MGEVGILVAGLPILRLIKPDVIVSVPVMIGIFFNLFIIGFRDCFTSYFSCTNRLIYVPAFITTSVASVFLSVVLLQWGGMKVWGLIIAPIVSQLAFNAWYWPLKGCKELGVKWSR